MRVTEKKQETLKKEMRSEIKEKPTLHVDEDILPGPFENPVSW